MRQLCFPATRKKRTVTRLSNRIESNHTQICWMKPAGHPSMTLVMGACVRVRDEVGLITRAPCPFGCTVINAESVKFINTAGRLSVASASAMRFFLFLLSFFLSRVRASILSSLNAKGEKKDTIDRFFPPSLSRRRRQDSLTRYWLMLA